MKLVWKVKPKADGNFEMSLGVKGYMSKQCGFGAVASIAFDIIFLEALTDEWQKE